MKEEAEMKNVLLVDSCIRKDASQTRRLLDAFCAALPEGYAVTRLVLTEENLSCLTGDFFDQRQRLLECGELTHPRFRYAHQFAQADIVVIAAPFWDLAFPALLKVYIENVSVDGITFAACEEGLKGICRGRDLVFLTTRGGFYTGSELEMGSRYLDALHTFFGFENYHCVAADGMNVAGFDAERALQEAILQAQNLAASL